MASPQRTCIDCSRPFTWDSGEQAYYRQRGLQPPRRCEACRAKRRRQPAAAPTESRPSQTSARQITRQQRGTARPAFGVMAVVAALVLGIVLLALSPLTPLISWLVAVNLITLLVYGYDKAIAGGAQRRVPEAVLLGLALLGGTVGALLGMLLFRHKTSKPAFLAPFAVLVIVQVVLLVVGLIYFERM